MTHKHSRRALPIATIVGAAMLLPLAASAGILPGDSLGKSEADVRAALTQQGYAVGEVETEDGTIQAEVTQNGSPLEIMVDRDSGKIVSVEQDDRDRSEGEGRDRD